MEIINSVLDYLARTNLFNFLIFAGIITFIVLKLDVKSKLESARKSVNQGIKDSETVKVVSAEKLEAIEKSIENLSEEVEQIILQSEENAKLVGNKILDDAKNSIAVIHENARKAIDNSHLILKNDIIRRASLASVEVAKAHIIEELKLNNELHDRLINESLSKIEGIEF